MHKRIFVILALAFALFATTSWAAPTSCTTEGGPCISNTFSPGTTRGVYEFGNGGRLIVDFDTVLTPFTLNVTLNHTIDPIDFSVFPQGTMCVPYPSGGCTQYDFTGDKNGPNGVPVKNVDYKRLITLTLSYMTPQTVHDPAFGHAPGDNATATYTEDILTSYSTIPLCTVIGCTDPTMGGKTPGLSSVVALDQPLASNDIFCLVSPQPNQTFSVGQEIEVEFRLFAGGSCPAGSGPPLRDKTARISVSTTDTSGNVIFPRLRNKEEGNKFHFDKEDGVNEFDLSTHKLLPGTYNITIFSSNFSPQSVNVIIVAGTDSDDDPD